MIEKYKLNDFTWYDIVSLDEEEFWPLVWKYNIDTTIAKIFLTQERQDRVIRLNNNISLSLSIPVQQGQKYVKEVVEVIIGKDFIITTNISDKPQISVFKNSLLDDTPLSHGEKQEHPAVYFLNNIFDAVYDNIIEDVDKLKVVIDDIEEKIFSRQEDIMVEKISRVNRKLIDIKKYLSTDDNIWKIFFELSENFFNKNNSNKYSMEGIMISYQQAYDETERLHDLVISLRDTNNSLLNAKLGRTSKVFTLIAFFTLPISLFVSIISVPTKQKHIFINSEYGFDMMVIFSIILFISMAIFAKWKKWW